MNYDKKTLADNLQLLAEFPDEKSINSFKERMGDELDKRLSMLTFPKDRVIYIKARVVDPFFTQMLFSMLYSKSKFDGSDRLQALGIEVEGLHWDGVYELNSRDKETIECAIQSMQLLLSKFDSGTNQSK